MDPLTIAIIGGLGIYALRNRGSAAVSPGPGVATGLTGGADPATAGGGLGVGFAKYGPQSDPRGWFLGIKPGTVTVGGHETASFDDAGNMKMAQTAAGLTATGVSAAEGIAMATTHSALFAGTTAGAAIPIIGIGVALVGTILGMISAHHKMALAAEGKALNTADPRAIDRLALILLGVLKGEITSIPAAQTQVTQAITDYYKEVKTVQRGKWPYTGQDLTADYQKVWIKRFQPPKGAPGYSDYHAPDPCNAACMVGHLFIERGGALVMAAVKEIFAGNHGNVVFPEIPSHATQSGLAAVSVVY